MITLLFSACFRASGWARYAFMPALFALIATASATHSQEIKRNEVEKIVREYLLENPEILLEMQQALEARQQQELVEQQQRTIRENADALFRSDHQVEFGDPDAKVTIVEFFDYNCGFCQRAAADMERLLESGQSVRFILKEFPVLGEASVQAHRISLAFSRLMPEKYPRYHIDLLAQQGMKDADRAMQLAIEMGANREALIEEAENPEILEAIRESYELADGLGISGTPSYVVGNEVVFGAVGYDRLVASIERQLQNPE